MLSTVPGFCVFLVVLSVVLGIELRALHKVGKHLHTSFSEKKNVSLTNFLPFSNTASAFTP